MFMGAGALPKDSRSPLRLLPILLRHLAHFQLAHAPWVRLKNLELKALDRRRHDFAAYRHAPGKQGHKAAKVVTSWGVSS